MMTIYFYGLGTASDLVVDGSGKLMDPLVINYNKKGVALSREQFSFDLNSDGKEEMVQNLASGSGFLVLDKNGKGTIDNGTELFGASTNDGFGELAQYDSDGNGWIDENDPVYYKLSVWKPGDHKGEGYLKSLEDLDVGAIYVNGRSTEMNLDGGKLKKTGIYLSDSGSPGIVQEVDLKTEEYEQKNSQISKNNLGEHWFVFLIPPILPVFC